MNDNDSNEITGFTTGFSFTKVVTGFAQGFIFTDENIVPTQTFEIWTFTTTANFDLGQSFSVDALNLGFAYEFDDVHFFTYENDSSNIASTLSKTNFAQTITDRYDANSHQHDHYANEPPANSSIPFALFDLDASTPKTSNGMRLDISDFLSQFAASDTLLPPINTWVFNQHLFSSNVRNTVQSVARITEVATSTTTTFDRLGLSVGVSVGQKLKVKSIEGTTNPFIDEDDVVEVVEIGGANTEDVVISYDGARVSGLSENDVFIQHGIELDAGNGEAVVPNPATQDSFPPTQRDPPFSPSLRF